MYRSVPEYPFKASQLRLEGKVEFSYDINELGLVENIVILESQPKNLFELSVFHSASTWRFNCQGIPRKGIVLTFLFKLSPERVIFDLSHI